MSNKKININGFHKYVFWNYKPDAELNEEIIIENVLLYGDLSDYKKLIGLVSKESIRNVLIKIEETGRYKKRINFVKKVIL